MRIWKPETVRSVFLNDLRKVAWKIPDCRELDGVTVCGVVAVLGSARSAKDCWRVEMPSRVEGSDSSDSDELKVAPTKSYEKHEPALARNTHQQSDLPAN